MDIYMGSILAGENAETPSPFDFALGGGGIDASCPLGANGTLLKEGTAIMVDMAGNYTAYMTDMTRVFSVGRLTEEAYRAHQVALTIQQEVENATRPGTACSDLYNIAANIAKKEGLSANFMGTEQQAKFVGHGIGIQINELPVLTPRSKEELLPNMVFALEPKFVIPGVGAVGIENSFLEKNISFSAFAGYYHHAGQCRGKGEREACQERDPFNPGRNLIGDYLYRPLVAMVPRSQQTEIEHRPVFVRNGAYAFF